MRCLIYLFISIGFFNSVFAQTNQPPKQKRQNIYFLKNNGSYTELRDSADFIRIISEPDSGSTLFPANEFYKNGKRKFIGKSSKSEYLSPEGQCMSYYTNGNRKSVENYIEGQLSGICYYFFPNGKLYDSKDFQPVKPNDNSVDGDANFNYLIKDCVDSTGKVLVSNGTGHFIGYDNNFKYIEEEGAVNAGKKDSTWIGKDIGLKIKFTEQYVDGKLIEGVSTDSSGIKHTYTKRLIEPQYKGGTAALYKYLGSHIDYPDYDLQRNIQGTVILGFVIKKDGTLKDIKIIKAAEDGLNQEAIRVLRRSTGWQPALYYGIPVNVYYTLPVEFALKD